MTARAKQDDGGAELPDTAQHWFRQTDKGKGIRLDGGQLDLLNAIGVGKVIADALADYQRNQCQQRAARSRSISGEGSSSSRGRAEITKSSGTIPPPDENEQLHRARRRPRMPKPRSTPSSSKSREASNVAPIAGAPTRQSRASS
jgi:hypothetical protein